MSSQIVQEYDRMSKMRNLDADGLAEWLVKTFNSGRCRFSDIYRALEHHIVVKGNHAAGSLFRDPQKVMAMIGSIRQPQFIVLPLVFCQFKVEGIRKQVGDLMQRHQLYYFAKQYEELQSLRPFDVHHPSYEDTKHKVYTMSYFVDRYGMVVDVNLQIRWLCMLGGHEEFEMRTIGEILQRVARLETEIKPAELWKILHLDLPGTGNIALVISQLKNSTAFVRLFSFELNKCEKPSVFFNKLFRDCMPPNTISFATKVVNEVRSFTSASMQDIISQFVLKVLCPNLSSSIHFVPLLELTEAILTQCKQLYLSDEEAKQLEALPLNKQHEKQHQNIIKMIKNKSSAFGQSSNTSKISSIKPPPALITQNNSKLFQQQPVPDTSKLSKPSNESPPYHLPHRNASNESRKEQIIFESEDFVGLPNIGNTCYINSFLINLYFCQDMRKLLKEQHSSSKTIDTLARIFEAIKIKNPVALQDLVKEFKASLPESFSSNDSQHDCMQFGRQLIDIMMTEQSLTKKVKQIFESRFEQVISCPLGHQSSKRAATETHIILSFDINSKVRSSNLSSNQPLNLNDMIERYFKSVRINTEFKCDKCLRKSDYCQKDIHKPVLPLVWIISLSRFTYNKQSQSYGKITDRVSASDYFFPSNILGPEAKSSKYKLNGFINHMGSTPMSGHYQAYIRHPTEQGRWLIFDDHYVMEMECKSTQALFASFSEADTPYILIYQMM